MRRPIWIAACVLAGCTAAFAQESEKPTAGTSTQLPPLPPPLAVPAPGAAVILAAGGGHRTLNVGSESANFVPYFYNCGVNTVILRNRLRNDGYDVGEHAVRGALQAIRLVRAHARAWSIDPARIGIVGFSAGSELAAPAAILFEEFDRKNADAADPLSKVSSRPDFVGLIYPGPTPFARGARPPLPRNAPPAFITCAGAGDRIHAIWATEYFTAMLQAAIPNVEMHVYGGR